MIIINPDHPFTLTAIKPARCLEQTPGPRDSVYLIRVGGTDRYLAESYVVRGDSYGVQRVYRAATAAQAHAQFDLSTLSTSGFTAEWAAAFGTNSELLHGLWTERQGAQAVAEVAHKQALSPTEEADARLGEVLGLARLANVHWALAIPVADRQSMDDREQALIAFNAKAALPELRQNLLAAGVAETTLQRLVALQGILHQEIGARAGRAAKLSQDSFPLRMMKGIVLGDLVLLANTAKTKLPEARREYYLLSTLLDLPERERRPDEPPAPTPMAAVLPRTADETLRWPAGTVVCTVPVAGGPALSAIAREDGTLAWVPATPGTTPTATATPATVAAADKTLTPPQPAPRRTRRR